MKSKVFVFALFAGVLTSSAAMAIDAQGVVDVYHVNLEVGGNRTGCIQFRQPDTSRLPNSWGCVYRTGLDLNVEFINHLLRDAALQRKRCRVFWNTTDGSGFARIFAAECEPRH